MTRDWVVAAFGCGVIVAVALYGCSSRAQSNPSKPAQSSEQQERNAPSAGNSVVQAPTYQPNCKRPENHDAADYCQQLRASEIADTAVWWTRFQTYLGMLGFVAVLFTLCLNIGATRAASRSASAAEKAIVAENRPWLAVNPTLASHLRFQDGDGKVTINFKTRNTGPSPALNAQLTAHLITQEERAVPLLKKIMDDQTAFYKRRATDGKVSAIGDTFFPDDEFGIRRSMTLDRDEIRKFTGDKKDAGFVILLVGSLSYRSSLTDIVHHTGFIYELRQPQPQKPNLSLYFGSGNGTYGMSQIRIERAFSSGWVD